MNKLKLKELTYVVIGIVFLQLSGCLSEETNDAVLVEQPGEDTGLTPPTPPPTPPAPPTPPPSTGNQPPVAVISATPTSGVAALEIQVDGGQSSDDGSTIQYEWNFGDGNVSQVQSTSHMYATAGSYDLTLTVTDDEGVTSSASTTIHVFDSIDNSQVVVPAGVTFFDDFQYEALRDAPYSRTESPFVASGGWSSIKAENIDGEANRASGYLYTVSEIPGYGGSFPGRNSTSVLAMEARPTGIPGAPNITPQTDFFLQYGDGNVPDTIPADVWFQFWVYSNRYDDPTNQNDQLSEYPDRFKFIYPCNTQYPCTSGNNRWKAMMGTASSEPFWVRGGRTELYVSNYDMDHVARYLPAPPENEFKLGQQDTARTITPNRWTLVKIHFDTSVAQGRFEVWLKPMGGQWAKVAEWIDGETPDFTWSVAAGDIGGHRMFRMPTTINEFESWMYLDDFAMATSEADLPVYPY